MDSSHFLVKMKHFVKSSSTTLPAANSNNELHQVPSAAFVSGSDIKNFYVKTVGKTALETEHKIEPKKIKFRDKPPVKQDASKKARFSVNSILKAVEAGDVKLVQQILEEHEESVNCVDQFGWTPLMSACCAGNIPMVELLLRWKPNVNVNDKKGNSCITLAKAKGHRDVVDILHKHLQSLSKPTEANWSSDEEEVLAEPSVFYCEVCKQNVENTSYKKHLSSTIHNFNVVSKRKMPTMYGIPESNKGFQILVKAGWNKEEGLGPSGDGHKFPPKTILKQDRTGLGAKKYKPRVTHTPEDARKEAKPKNTYKRQLKSEKVKLQRQERNLRRMLS